ncbi:Dscam [Cordylochernes scorpioides]|uniref:Dscam n=1 Tax=Cordylochernes scorpioides TaxID=51811 RepID=A0ABY6K3I6_9ARAC|nr:Dscam [Cordylochernes scorpioides]
MCLFIISKSSFINEISFFSIKVPFFYISYNLRSAEYVLRYKREFGQWEETKVPAHPAKFSLTGLRCGTVYSLYLSRPRDDGSPPSNVVTSRTLGSAPVAPDKEVFLTASNSTGLLLALGEWDDGGCPIKSFVVRYKSFWSTEWRVAPAAVTQPAPRPLYLGSLTPATWYHLRVTAHNGAGSTAAEYEMATLTWEGAWCPGTIAPVVPLETREHQPGVWDDVHLAVPVVVAILALLVVGGVALCVCLKRRHFQEEIYERPAPLQRKSLPCSTGKSPEGTQVRETSLYQTCLAKGGPPPNTQAPPSSQDLAGRCPPSPPPWAPATPCCSQTMRTTSRPMLRSGCRASTRTPRARRARSANSRPSTNPTCSELPPPVSSTGVISHDKLYASSTNLTCSESSHRQSAPPGRWFMLGYSPFTKVFHGVCSPYISASIS